MKVYKKIDDMAAILRLEPTYQDVLISQIRRVIDELVPIRDNYYKTKNYIDEQLSGILDYLKDVVFIYASNGIDVEVQYQPYDYLLYTRILSIISEDRYSFKHIDTLLRQRCNKIIGFVEYPIMEASDEATEYAISFDIDDLDDIYNNGIDTHTRIGARIEIERLLLNSKRVKTKYPDTKELKAQYHHKASDYRKSINKELHKDDTIKKYCPKGDNIIDVTVIHSHIVEHVKNSRLTVEMLEKAICSADFSDVMDDAIKCHLVSYPLSVISHLKTCFESEWYTDSCKSINTEPKHVSGRNTMTGRSIEFEDFFPSTNNFLFKAPQK